MCMKGFEDLTSSNWIFKLTMRPQKSLVFNDFKLKN